MAINKFDDLTSLFDGVLTDFDLKVGGTSAILPTDRDLDISVGGVSLHENVDYAISGSTISFGRAPLSGDVFKGEYINLDIEYSNLLNAPQIANGETLAENGQTVFNLNGVNGTPYNIHVYLNGIKLSTTDYTANYLGAQNILQITLTEPCVLNDVLGITTSHQGGTNATVVSGHVTGNDLILVKSDGSSISIDVSSLIN